MTDADDRFEDFLRKEAREYNAPRGEVPREEMWAEVQLRRKVQGGRRKAEGGSRRMWFALAATLLIGVAIGTFASRPRLSSPGAAVATVGPAPASPSETADRTYQVATSVHLSRAEALLTAYGSSAGDPGADAQLSRWARDMLSDTRLLLDSPAARDPARRQLMSDLELVLVQIVQRAPADGAAEDRAHVNRSLERTQMLTRLRSVLPAELNSGT
jgi:hypothetical protein